MKVGIITFHRAHNYGAVLQAYALQEIFKMAGIRAEFIDYRQPDIESYYKSHYNFHHIVKCIFHLKPKQLKKHLLLNMQISYRCFLFYLFRKKYLSCSKPVESVDDIKEYDRYVIGSDQVWGIHCYGKYDPIYWGGFKRPPDSKLYGYAISANGDYRIHLSDGQIKRNVLGFDDIAFREETIANDIERITGIKKNVVLDPTLLADEKIWESMVNEKWRLRKYIAVYHIRESDLCNNFIMYEAKSLAERKNIEVVNLSMMNYSVEDFVSAIKYADYVFTSSFHAVVFSVIFRRSFWAFRLNDGHDGRYCDLLDEIGLAHNIVDRIILDDEPEMIDNAELNCKLSLLKKDSMSYIKTIIAH